jgi:hypothetical protein
MSVFLNRKLSVAPATSMTTSSLLEGVVYGKKVQYESQSGAWFIAKNVGFGKVSRNGHEFYPRRIRNRPTPVLA